MKEEPLRVLISYQSPGMRQTDPHLSHTEALYTSWKPPPCVFGVVSACLEPRYCWLFAIQARRLRGTCREKPGNKLSWPSIIEIERAYGNRTDSNTETTYVLSPESNEFM